MLAVFLSDNTYWFVACATRHPANVRQDLYQLAQSLPLESAALHAAGRLAAPCDPRRPAAPAPAQREGKEQAYSRLLLGTPAADHPPTPNRELSKK
jgi:hypothetical protein